MVGMASEKVLVPTLGASPRNVTAVRLVNPKAPSPMLVTPLPIVILVRWVQKPKAPPPMLVTLSGIVMLVRLLHFAKA